MMIQFLKTILIVVVTLLLVGYISLKLVNEPVPEGETGKRADDLAMKMMNSINDSAWQNTGAIQWGFRENKHIWDRKRHLAAVKFKGNHVLIDINRRIGLIVNNESQLSLDQKKKLCNQAWKYWANDSFWLNPISKIFDPGVERKLVELEDGSSALLVTYTSGGVTPGDAYLWLVDKNARPKAWKFWVSIIPLGGMHFTWEGWQTLETGAQVATVHSGILDIKIDQPIGKKSLIELAKKDIFVQLKNAGDELVSF